MHAEPKKRDTRWHLTAIDARASHSISAQGVALLLSSIPDHSHFRRWLCLATDADAAETILLGGKKNRLIADSLWQEALTPVWFLVIPLERPRLELAELGSRDR